MKYIAFDIGDKRIGIAVSDPFGEFALPLETYNRKNFNKDLEYLAKIASDRYADVIVCGLPLNFDGSESEQTKKTLSFVEELKKHTQIPIVFEDERFTTKQAERDLISGNVKRADRKLYVDKLAATYILETYMVLGGIPFYWDMLRKDLSWAQNIDRLFFHPNGKMRNEFEALYKSLFRYPKSYIDVVSALATNRGKEYNQRVRSVTDHIL